MGAIQRVVKPSTRKGKRILKAREPQVSEGPKQVLFFQGRKTSEKIRRLIKDMYDLKKPDAQRYTKKHDITIFEDATPVEQMCSKIQSTLFCMGSHSKKRPDNIVLGRLYNDSLLDMYELEVIHYEGLKDFDCPKITLGTKPAMIFNGPTWDMNLQSMLTDFFHREPAETIRLQGLEHVISFTMTSESAFSFRSYRVHMKKSGVNIPRIELEEMGPSIDFKIRRKKLASPDLMKEACEKPQILRVRKKKNVSMDGLGNTHGNIHVGRQNLDTLQTRKMKGLKQSHQERQGRKRKRIVVINSETSDSPPKRVAIDG